MAFMTQTGKFQDALSSGGVVVGHRRFDVTSCSIEALSRCETTLTVNGKLVAEGSGSACAGGGPVQAVAFLANHLNARGMDLMAGHFVATGQTCLYRGVAVGDRIVAEFQPWGNVSMTVGS
jgi:2-keto-4-pentenoate hydratase